KEMAARLDRVGQAAERMEHRLVVREQFVQTGNDGNRRPRLDRGQRSPVEGIADFQIHVGEAKPVPKARSGMPVLIHVVAQDRGDWKCVELLDRLQKVASRTGGNVEQPDRLAGGVGLCDRRSQGLFQQPSPDTDAPPTDGVEIKAIDESSERRYPLRPVLVDVIEHGAGIETILPAKPDAAAQTAGTLHQPAHRCEATAAWRAEAVVFIARVATAASVQERWGRRRCREACADEVANLRDNHEPALLVEECVREPPQTLESFYRR